jgi:hypothetical protein
MDGKGRDDLGLRRMPLGNPRTLLQSHHSSDNRFHDLGGASGDGAHAHAQGDSEILRWGCGRLNFSGKAGKTSSAPERAIYLRQVNLEWPGSPF